MGSRISASPGWEPMAADPRMLKVRGLTGGGSTMSVYCTRCGAGLPASASFCSNCGAVVPTPQAAPGRPLIRPRIGRQIAGVCMALARSYGWDVSAVRIITVLAFFFSSGLVGIAYLAAWIGIPEDSPEVSNASAPRASAPGATPPGVYPPGV